jgi:hypothetical protein
MARLESAQSNPQRAGGQPGGNLLGFRVSNCSRNRRLSAKRVGNWLNRSQSYIAFFLTTMMKQKAY